MVWVLGISFLGIFGGSLPAQNIQINGSDIYHHGSLVQGKFKTIFEEDSVILYAQIAFTNPASDSITLSTTTVDDEGNSVKGDLMLHHALYNHSNRIFLFKWEFPEDRAPVNFTVQVQIKPRVWSFSEGIAPKAAHPQGGVHIENTSTGYPFLNSFIHTTDSLTIQSVRSDTVFAYYYRHSFDPARPPMSLNRTGSGSDLKIDSVISLPTQRKLTLPLPGLYFIQADTNGIQGVSLFVGTSGYPKPRKVAELTEPLIYITTKDEFEDLKEDFSNKKALDKFWLSTVGNPLKARGAIKRYYQLVEQANIYFTSYKQGWKTDRGMIFSVMGPPLAVIKNQDLETWSYQQGDNEVNFTFQKVVNIFSDNHYELHRQEDLDRPWFRAIDRWRKGLTGL